MKRNKSRTAKHAKPATAKKISRASVDRANSHRWNALITFMRGTDLGAFIPLSNGQRVFLQRYGGGVVARLELKL